jgi:hypothetical protein
MSLNSIALLSHELSLANAILFNQFISVVFYSFSINALKVLCFSAFFTIDLKSLIAKAVITTGTPTAKYSLIFNG